MIISKGVGQCRGAKKSRSLSASIPLDYTGMPYSSTVHTKMLFSKGKQGVLTRSVPALMPVTRAPDSPARAALSRDSPPSSLTSLPKKTFCYTIPAVQAEEPMTAKDDGPPTSGLFFWSSFSKYLGVWGWPHVDAARNSLSRGSSPNPLPFPVFTGQDVHRRPS